jgi:hypothetical protein
MSLQHPNQGFPARFQGWCAECDYRIEVDELITAVGNGQFAHTACPEEKSTRFTGTTLEERWATDVLVPVPLRWRHVIAGDVFIGRDDQEWIVTKNGYHWEWTGWDLFVEREGRVVRAGRRIDPDDVVEVFVPAVERDAVELIREQLGARLIERRTT